MEKNIEGQPMKERAAIIVNDTLTVLLFALPQGMLSAVVWLVYGAWTALAMQWLTKA
jgi:hypothetical protein